MTVELTSFYLDNIQPLCLVNLDELEPNNTYITSDGSRIKIQEDLDVILIKDSVLVEGEKVGDLGKDALRLFFILMNK